MVIIHHVGRRHLPAHFPTGLDTVRAAGHRDDHVILVIAALWPYAVNPGILAREIDWRKQLFPECAAGSFPKEAFRSLVSYLTGLIFTKIEVRRVPPHRCGSAHERGWRRGLTRLPGLVYVVAMIFGTDRRGVRESQLGKLPLPLPCVASRLDMETRALGSD